MNGSAKNAASILHQIFLQNVRICVRKNINLEVEIYIEIWNIIETCIIFLIFKEIEVKS